MARTIAEIKAEMTTAFMADTTLKEKYGFDTTKSFSENFSKVSLESILFSIVATVIWTLECLFDQHQQEVSDTISNRAHTLNWYRNKALAFQYGCDLDDETAEYDNTGLTDEQIEETQIVTKCACIDAQQTYPTIMVKAVTSSGKMTTDQLSAFTAYMTQIADAGMKLDIISKDPDTLGLSAIIWVDPLLINSEGTLYNEGTKNIVATYINNYLASLPYNGAFYPKMLESYLMQQEGVTMAKITLAKATSGTSVETIADKYIPVSGALTYDPAYSGMTITYEQL